MNNRITQSPLVKPFLPDILERGKIWLVFLLMLFSSWWCIGQSVPDYTFAEGKNLDEVNVTIADVFNLDAKINRIILAVDVNSKGEVFVLTFGNGIKKVGPDGELINFIANTNNRLSSPMDFAINSEDKFFVATNESNLRFVRVFSPTGEYLQNETLGDGSYGTGPDKFKGPTGLAFDKDDNLYVADHYIGTAVQPKPSAIKIYQKTNAGVYKNNLLKEFDNVEGTLLNFPYRLAVNSKGLVYMAESGENDNAKVKIIELDANLDPGFVGEISGSELGTPGSVIIDDFDYAFIADFGDEVTMTQILEASGDAAGMMEVFEDIKEGIENNIFNINIYNPNRTFYGKISDKIDFVIDLAISNCGDLNVNNGNFYGTTKPIFATDVTFDFDLEIYTRSPGYDTEDPIIICQENIEVTAAEGEDNAEVNFPTPDATDNCAVTVSQTNGKTSGSDFAIGDHLIEFTATDAAGNESSCTFTITVNPSDDEGEPVTFENCPSDIIKTTDAGECGAIVTFDTPTASDESGTVEVIQTEGPDSGDLFPLNTTRVTFEATGSDGTTVTCSFTVTVNDEEDPEINCPSDITETANSGEDFAVVEFDTPTATDNCSVTVSQTNGKTSGSDFAIGDHLIEFTATDAAGNKSTCTFTITVNPSDEEEPATFENCPANIIKTTDAGECGAIVTFDTPTASDENGTVEVNQIEGPSSGDRFPLNTTRVTFEATGSDGTTVTCSFTVTVNDEENPEINCPSDITETADPGENFAVVEFATPTAVDNCSGTTVDQTDGLTSGSNFTIGDHVIEFTATDAAGNKSTCTFTITVNPSEDEGEPATFENCPADIIKTTDAGECGAIVTFDTPTASDENGTVEVNQTEGPNSGDIFPTGTTRITFEATGSDGATVTCSFTVTVNDEEDPVVNCVPGFQLELNSNGTASISAEEINDGSSDNCGIVNMEIDKTRFTTADLGENTIELSITDAAGNISTCETIVTVISNDPPPPDNFTCKEQYTLELDASGEATVNAEDLFTGDAGDREFSLSRSTFTCEDVGNTTIILSYSGDDGDGDCEINIEIKDISTPEVRTQDITITLDGQGEAIINPDMIDDGTTDNCGEVELSLDRTVFTCDDLGKNQVVLSALDQNGNTATATANVTVVGDCDHEPPVEEDVNYIYVYPNPTPGPFRFAVPQNVVIEKVEVYDVRGRFILAEEFLDSSVYSMDLTGLQRAIYVLKIFTKDRIETVRIIVY